MSTTAWLPVVKPEHGAFRTANQRVRIGGSVYGIAAEVADADGIIWTMFSVADGTRAPDQIVEVVLAAHPTGKPAAVHAALEQLTDAGYLTDAAASDPPELTAREKERYDRSRGPSGGSTSLRERAAGRPSYA